MTEAESFPSPENDRLLTRRELADEWGVDFCRQHLSRLEEQGSFPRRVRLGERSVRWWQSEIRAWWAQRDAERKGQSRPAVAAGGGE